MYIGVVTLFPELYKIISDYGVTGRAIQKGLLSVDFWNPRDYANDKHRTVDDRPYGGGPGMVMMVEPLRTTLQHAKKHVAKVTGDNVKVIHLTPQGKTLNQSSLNQLALESGLVLLASRYEGIDERLTNEIDAEYSIGDYVLSGGEIPSLVIIDGIARLLPGALGDTESAQQDSFMNGLLDCPHYTRPERIDDSSVPSVLLSGDHKAIARWRQKQALGRTWLRRPDLLQQLELDDVQSALLREFIQENEQDLKSRYNELHKIDGARHE